MDDDIGANAFDEGRQLRIWQPTTSHFAGAGGLCISWRGQRDDLCPLAGESLGHGATDEATRSSHQNARRHPCAFRTPIAMP
jgi:hypothetical protein